MYGEARFFCDGLNVQRVEAVTTASRGTVLARLISKQVVIQVKFINFEKAKKFCKIFPLLLTTVQEKISQDFVAFSENMNFKSLSDQEEQY